MMICDDCCWTVPMWRFQHFLKLSHVSVSWNIYSRRIPNRLSGLETLLCNSHSDYTPRVFPLFPHAFRIRQVKSCVVVTQVGLPARSLYDFLTGLLWWHNLQSKSPFETECMTIYKWTWPVYETDSSLKLTSHVSGRFCSFDLMFCAVCGRNRLKGGFCRYWIRLFKIISPHNTIILQNKMSF